MGKFSSNTMEEEENQICPEGIHDMRVGMVDDNKRSKAGDWMAKVEFEVVNGVNAGLTAVDYIIIPNVGSPAIKIMGKTRHFLHCIGEPYEGKLSGNTENWYRKPIRCEVKHELFNNQKSAKVSKYILVEETPIASDPSNANDKEIPF